MHDLRVTLICLEQFEQILFGLRDVVSQELLLVGETLVPVLRVLSDVFLDEMVTFTDCLVFGNCHVLVELTFAGTNHVSDCFAHLSSQEHIQLRVEVVNFVLVETHELALLAEVLAHDPHNSLLHFLLKDVVLSCRINLVEELFPPVLISLHGLGLSYRLLRLFLQLLAKGEVVLACQGFYCDRNLLFEVIGGYLRKRPPDQSLRRDDLVRLGLRILGDLRHNGVTQLN